MRFARMGVALVSLLPAIASAQSAVFRGVVYRDSLHHTLAGADVSLPEIQERGLTNAAGQFELRGLPAGIWTVVVRRVGFAPITDSIHVFSGQDIRRDFAMLATATQLDSVRVVASGPVASVSPAMRAFERNRAAGFGHYITPKELRKVEDRKLTEILRALPGTTIYAYRSYRFLGSGRGLSSIPGPQSRGAGPGMQHAIVGDATSPVACWVQVLLNGLRLYTPNSGLDAPDIEALQGKEFEAIEFYGGPASTPAEYGGTGATCGTLVLWSRERVDPP